MNMKHEISPEIPSKLTQFPDAMVPEPRHSNDSAIKHDRLTELSNVSAQAHRQLMKIH